MTEPCWPTDHVLFLIDLYQENRVLWDHTLDSHKDLCAIEEARKRIVEELSKKGWVYSIKQVTKKLNSLRTNFKRTDKKIKDSKVSGISADTVYKPRNDLHTRLKFLNSIEPSTSERTCTLDDNCDTPTHDDVNVLLEPNGLDCSSVPFSVEQEYVNQGASGSKYVSSGSFQPKVIQSADPPEVKRRRVYSGGERDRLYNAAITRLTTSTPDIPKKPVDVDELVGQTIGEKLKRLDPDMKIYCEKLMFDAIFKAQCRDLNKSSYILTPLDE